ncbi:MAG: DMT family transporter [Elusimicrobiota bacterium]
MTDSGPGIGPGKRLLLDLGLVYAALIWGATFFLVKGVLDHVHPVALVGWRFIISGLLMLPLALRRRNPARHLKEGLVLGSILMLLYVTQTAGLLHTTASNSGFITGLFVFFVPLFLLLFFRRPPDKGQWAAVAVAVAGLWLLTGGLAGFNQGDVMTLFAAMAYAAHVLATDRFVRRDADAVLLAFHQFWICGAACLVLAGASGAGLRVGSPRAMWIILFLAVFPNLSAFFIQLIAQKHTPPVKVSLIFSLEPVFAALFAWTIGGEVFVGRKALGGALIVAAMILGELSRRSLRKGRSQEVLPV